MDEEIVLSQGEWEELWSINRKTETHGTRLSVYQLITFLFNDLEDKKSGAKPVAPIWGGRLSRLTSVQDRQGMFELERLIANVWTLPEYISVSGSHVNYEMETPVVKPRNKHRTLAIRSAESNIEPSAKLKPEPVQVTVTKKEAKPIVVSTPKQEPATKVKPKPVEKPKRTQGLTKSRARHSNKRSDIEKWHSLASEILDNNIHLAMTDTVIQRNLLHIHEGKELSKSVTFQTYLNWLVFGKNLSEAQAKNAFTYVVDYLKKYDKSKLPEYEPF